MASNIKFGVQIDAGVTGRESVEQLTARLDEMAKVLEGELKQEALNAAAGLRELGQQQAAITAVEQLKRSVTEAGQALKRADAEAEAFGKQVALAGPPTAQEAQQLQKLQAAAAAASSSLQAQKAALAGAVAELQRHGVAANQTQAAQQRLNGELAELRTRAEGLAPAWRGSAAAAAEAGAQMQRTHRAIGDGVQSISTQLARVQAAYLALSGGGVLGGMVKDVVQTADAFNTLSARIKLVTGDGAAFESALEGVQRVAIATRSDLEATGTLFTKLATAGKELGLSQGQALALTQTINEAIQITGGSADAAKAAITQLTQGLQSGTLRGDEFNSVMEQAPRLAQALAAGLGVGTGELRKMAEQGRLTSEAVITALRGQTDAVAAEFAKLPPTVGGALQNLSTAWTGFVGELNQGTGATQKLAEGLKFVADHLDTIAGAAGTLGQGAIAVGVLRIAQSFLGWANNARLVAVETAAASAATAAATAATTANTAATTANTAATVANAAARTGLAAAAAGVASGMGQATAAKTGAATAGGLLSAAWGSAAAAGRGLLSLIGGPAGLVVLTAAYAKDIGELAAKLVLKAKGLKTVEEAEAALQKQQQEAVAQAERLKEARDREIAADKAATDAKFGLGKAASALVQNFDELIEKSKSTDDALNEIGKGFDLSKQAGIRDAAGVLDKLLATGKITAEQFDAAWAKALDGRDLLKFEVMARAALDGTGRAAEQLSQALDAQLGEAVRRTGLDFDLIRGGMSKASISVQNDIDTLIGGLGKLKAQGVDVATVLTTRLGQGLKTADSQQAIDELRTRIESLRNVLGDQVADGLLAQAGRQLDELKLKADQAKPGVNSLAEAMKLLGVTSQEALRKTAADFKDAYELMRTSGQATVSELREGFVRYAEAAIKANGGVASGALQAEAAIRGVRIEGDRVVDALGRAERAGHRAGDGIEAGMRRGQRAAQEAVNAMSEALRKVGALTDAVGRVTRNADGTTPGGASGIKPGSWEGYGYGDDKRNAEQRANVAKQGGAIDSSFPFLVMQRLARGESFGADELPALQNAYRAALHNQSMGQPGSVTLEGRRQDEAIAAALRRAMESAQYAAAAANDSTGAQRGRAGGPQSQLGSGGTVVNINLSGRQHTVNVASNADAQALEALLRELQDAQGRTGT